MAGLIWAAVVLLVAVGDGVGMLYRRGAVAPVPKSPDLPARVWGLIYVVGLGPFAWYLFRRELAGRNRSIICPGCDTAAEGEAGSPCGCGGRFVPLSTVKWVEEGPKHN